MSFLSPWVLGGLAAVGVPILIHLLNKFRVKSTAWGAMRFLNDAVLKNQRRVKLDELILLVLRCLVIALAVLAFARPVLKGLGVGGGSEPVAAVILLDHSASMGQSDGAQSRFDRAKSEIRSWLDQQDSQSLVGLYLAGSRTVPLIGKPENDFAMVRKSLDEAVVSDYASDFSQALRSAVEALQNVTGHPREIRIYTDGQATAFLKRDELKLLAREHPEIVIRPVVVGEAASENLGITSLSQEGGVPSVGQPVRIRAEVLNSGAAPVNGLAVNFTIDGSQPAGSATIPAIAPGETQAVTMNLSFTDAGPHFVTATVPADALACDNQRNVALDVAGRMDVVIVAGEAMAQAGYFLSRALVPVPREQAEHYFLAPRFANAAELATMIAAAKDERPEIVFLCEPAGLTGEAAEALDTYVTSGGNVVVFPGSASGLGAEGTPEGLVKMLPGTLGAPVEAAANEAPVAWQKDGFTHEITRFWNESSNGGLGSVKFTRHCPLTLKSDAATVLAFADGKPSLAEWRHGKGTVLLFNANLTREWTNLPLHPAFVPFLQRITGFVHDRNRANLNLAPGETLRMPVDDSLAGKDFTVKAPDAANARTAGQVASDESGSYLRYGATEKAGVYQIEVANEPVADFAVQLASSESDLRPVDPAVMTELAEVPRTSATGGDARMVVKKEFWTTLIWAVVALFVAEAAMAHRMSYAR
ncbi:BatA domain-containing protein [Luteolibacter soli]|uniref:BatA domain-containing protein n=1 Tax=Luteolibacter soli TaxID=3135280 RepID=A0ABU9B2N7_9BACT